MHKKTQPQFAFITSFDFDFVSCFVVASQTRCQQRRIRRTTAMADAVWRMDQVEESAWKHRLCELGRTPPGTPKALTTPWFSISYSYFGDIGVCLVVVVSCIEFTMHMHMHIHIHMLMHMIAEPLFDPLAHI